MRRSPEESYAQHREDAERITKAQKAKTKSEQAHGQKVITAEDLLKQHRDEDHADWDTSKHPELWEMASETYQDELKIQIDKAVADKDYDRVQTLIFEIQAHQTRKAEYQKAYACGTDVKGAREFPVVTETKAELLKIFSEEDWQKAKDEFHKMEQRLSTSGGTSNGFDEERLLKLLSGAREFDPKRFEQEFGEIQGDLWQKLLVAVEKEEEHPDYYLYYAHKLKKINPKLFAEQFWQRMGAGHKEKIWSEIMRKLRAYKNYPAHFLYNASSIKYLDPQRFEEYIGGNMEFEQVIWPKIIEGLEDMTKHSGFFYARCAGLAQSIKPAGQPDLTITPRMLTEIHGEIAHELRCDASAFAFELANATSRLRIEKDYKK